MSEHSMQSMMNFDRFSLAGGRLKLVSNSNEKQRKQGGCHTEQVGNVQRTGGGCRDGIFTRGSVFLHFTCNSIK